MSEKPSLDTNIDSIFYRDGVSSPLAMRVLKTARQNIFSLFMEKMKPTPECRVLDIGVSDDENEGANFLEKSYPWPGRLTCAGLGSGEQVKTRYPDVHFQKIAAGEPLPFLERSFDIATSNAVLEHVGGPRERSEFLLEHLRVARRVFISVPHRWFPIEHHTNLPLVHYAPSFFRSILKKTSLSYWTDPKNVDFIDKRLIMREWPGKHKPEILMTGLQLGPFSSNLAIISSN